MPEQVYRFHTTQDGGHQACVEGVSISVGSQTQEKTVTIWGEKYTEAQARMMFCNPNVEMSIMERNMRGRIA